MPLSLARNHRPRLERRPEPSNDVNGPVVHTGREVVELGTISKASGRTIQYVAIDGAEYRLGEPTSDPMPGHYLQGADRDTFLPLVRVELGTYHRAATGPAAAQPAKPPRVVDVLTTLPALRGTPDLFLPRPATLGADRNVVAGAVTSIRASGYAEGRAPLRSFRGILARYQSRCELSIVAGRLVIRTASRLTVDDLDVLRLVEPYLVGLLSGSPVPCAFEHAEPVEATRLLAVDVPACAEHAT
jgi:hypothetical protein